MPDNNAGDALPFDPEAKDVVCRRDPDTGAVVVNIPRAHTHHSPAGFEWGSSGSGPADFALNVAALFLPLSPGEVGVELRDGSEVSADAWEVYQDLKRELIALLPEAGGTILGDEIRDWLLGHGVEPRG